MLTKGLTHGPGHLMHRCSSNDASGLHQLWAASLSQATLDGSSILSGSASW